jgi:hypothetical protein
MYNAIERDLIDYLGERTAEKVQIQKLLDFMYLVMRAPETDTTAPFRAIIDEEKERRRKIKDIELELQIKTGMR